MDLLTGGKVPKFRRLYKRSKEGLKRKMMGLSTPNNLLYTKSEKNKVMDHLVRELKTRNSFSKKIQTFPFFQVLLCRRDVRIGSVYN